MNRSKKNKKDSRLSYLPVVAASVLSLASLVWTTYSVVDLLGAGPWGFTVAAGADIIWASILYAEYKGLEINGSRGAVIGIGWAAIASVVGLLVWHGLDESNIPMAVGGPLLPLGAKVVWLLAIAAHRDPTELTADQKAEVNNLMRESEYHARKAEAEREKIRRQHEDELARIEMDSELALARENSEAELQIARGENDLKIDLSREEARRELARRTPLTIPGHTVPNRPAIESAPEVGGQGKGPAKEFVVGGLADLSEAQRRKKRLVALLLHERALAEAEGRELTQAEFCRRIGVNPPNLSKALAAFPPEVITEEDIAEAQQQAAS